LERAAHLSGRRRKPVDRVFLIACRAFHNF
jgi:hypothetical protein